MEPEGTVLVASDVKQPGVQESHEGAQAPVVISAQTIDLNDLKSALPELPLDGTAKEEAPNHESVKTGSLLLRTVNGFGKKAKNGPQKTPDASNANGPEPNGSYFSTDHHQVSTDGNDEHEIVEEAEAKKTVFNSRSELKKKAVDKFTTPLFNTAIFRYSKVTNTRSSDSEVDELEDAAALEGDNIDGVTENGDSTMYPKFAKRHKPLISASDAVVMQSDGTNGKEREFFSSFSMRKLKKARTKSDAAIDDSNIMNESDQLFQEAEESQQFAHSDTEINQTTQKSDAPPKKRYRLRNYSYHANSENAPSHSRKNTIFMDHSPAIDWKDLKNSLKFNILGASKKKKETTDTSYLKSAELISELSAGAPAAIILASMFQRDDRNTQRIPILLEQIKLKLTDISPNLKEKNRHYLLELEYGSGPARLRWSVRKEFKDFWSFHSKFKVVTFQNNIGGTKLSLPKFPARHSIYQKVEQKHKEANPSKKGETVDSSGIISPHRSPAHNLQATAPSAAALSRHPSTISEDSRSIMSVSTQSLSGSYQSSKKKKMSHFPRKIGDKFDTSEFNEATSKEYVEELRLALEKYILELFKTLRFRADANRLFQFLEVSNMTIRLAPESSFHGKEGYLILRSSATLQGWRVSHWRPNDISQMVVRHTSKWYMVRESYILCVKDISDSNILEVFLVDPGFKVTHGDSGKFGEDDEPGSSHAHITFNLENLERKMKLVTNSRRQLGLWMDSIIQMKENTVWSKQHRFNSFAPVRTNVQAQWFVDAVSN